MATRTVPLARNQAHQRLRVEISGVQLRLRLDWLERYGYFVVSIYRNDELLTAGRGLHPEMDLLRHLKLGLGKLYVKGPAPTPENIGAASRLVVEEP